MKHHRPISETEQSRLRESNRTIKMLQLQKDNLVLQFLTDDERARKLLSDLEREFAAQQKLLSGIFAAHGCKPQEWTLDVDARRFEPRR